MTRLALALGLIAALASGMAAQSAPNITKPKQAAARAVAATNARTTASTTLPDDPTPSGAEGTRASRGRIAATDSAAGTTADPASTAEPASTEAREPAKVPGFERETFSYARSGRRDPFLSLMNTSELRPLITELKLVAIAFDPSGRSSVAVLRDLGTKEQYRVRVGHTLGRMRVAGITTRAVVFTIEEFGYSRQETLGLGDPNQEMKQ